MYLLGDLHVRPSSNTISDEMTNERQQTLHCCIGGGEVLSVKIYKV